MKEREGKKREREFHLQLKYEVLIWKGGSAALSAASLPTQSDLEIQYFYKARCPVDSSSAVRCVSKV